MGKNSNFVDSFIETISDAEKANNDNNKDAEKANNDNNKNLATKDWFAKTKTLYKASIENKNIKNIAFIGKKAWNTTELVNYLNKTNHRNYKIGREIIDISLINTDTKNQESIGKAIWGQLKYKNNSNNKKRKALVIFGLVFFFFSGFVVSTSIIFIHPLPKNYFSCWWL